MIRSPDDGSVKGLVLVPFPRVDPVLPGWVGTLVAQWWWLVFVAMGVCVVLYAWSPRVGTVAMVVLGSLGSMFVLMARGGSIEEIAVWLVPGLVVTPVLGHFLGSWWRRLSLARGREQAKGVRER